MPGLLTLPIVLPRMAFWAFKGLLDTLAGRNRLHSEFTVLINAPREAVWQFCIAGHVVLDGPPAMEIFSELLPDNPGLRLNRIFINGQLQVRTVSREVERDDDKRIYRARLIDHALCIPPEDGRNVESGIVVASTPTGTTLTMYNETTVRYFRDRINYPLAPRQMAYLVKHQCEKAAGTYNQPAILTNQGWLLSFAALLSFCYLLGWREGLLLAIVVVLHELGHALAMLMTGVGIRGIYLIPFFGGAAVPRTAYRTAGRLGFIALMGPAFSLVPTLVVLAMFRSTGSIDLRKAAEMFALINVANLLPLYPLDGGQIFNALAGSVSQRAALVTGWIGILAGLGLALYLQSFLIGIPFLLFALQRYLAGGKPMELERLSLAGGIALALASIATFVVYVLVVTATAKNSTRPHPNEWARPDSARDSLPTARRPAPHPPLRSP
jgi:Zn-dependent protease